MIRTLLQFRNLDLTKDINDRYTRFITRGICDGGDVQPVSGRLQVEIVAPWKVVSEAGMVVEETSETYRLDTPAGQTTVVAVKAIYNSNNVPEIEVVAIEESSYGLLSDPENYIIFCYVAVPISSTFVVSDNILFKYRDVLDKVTRNTFRGVLTSAGALPPAKDNVSGDMYVVADGLGGIPHIYGWSGTQWFILTDAAQVASDLSAHRQDLFDDEKHLTDDEKDAMAGTSGTQLSSVNKVVDNADSRIPTQSENDALAGTDGSPSNTNPYVTSAYPLATPEEKSVGVPGGGSIEILSIEGPVYVGRGGAGSADPYFKFYDSTSNREYLTTTGVIVSVDGVYTDSILTQVLDPSIHPSVDADGFYSNSSIYIKFDVTPDTGLRLLYGKRYTLAAMPLDALLRRTLNDSQISASTLKVIEDIKGRDFDTVPPNNEQNIELRKDIVDLKEYVSAVFKADHVIGDFTKVEGVPDFVNDFKNNIGIPQSYAYENTGLVSYTYDFTTATITYSTPVSLGGVVAGHVFIDGALNEYEVVTIPSMQEVTIKKRNGIIPHTINTTVTLSSHGSIKPDNNPRKINLATLDYIIGRERISCREIEVIPNEFHPRTNNVAFQIRTPLVSAYFREPRIRFYGGFQNRDSGTRARVVATNTGNISITGFFTSVRLLLDLKTASPSILVKIDGDLTGATIDLSRSGKVADLGNEADIQQQSVGIATGLTDLIPHTIEVEILNNTDDFIIHGVDLIRDFVSNIALISGRAFVQSDLYKKDAISTFTPPTVTTRSRGAVSTYYINRSLVGNTKLTILADFDGLAGGPSGAAVSGSPLFQVSSGLTKFQNYKVGDIVKVITATAEEVHVIDVITPLSPTVVEITFSDNVTTSGAAILIHVASSVGDSVDPIREYNRYTPEQLGGRQLTDFSILFFAASDRIFSVEDGTTSIAGTNLRYVTTGIDGVNTALELIDSTSVLKIRTIGIELGLLTANNTSATAEFSIDGSPVYPVNIPSNGLTKIVGWTNARYQSHELTISNAAGMKIAGIILQEPTHATKIEGSLIATQNLIAEYDSSSSEDGDIIPTGVIAVDPFIMGGVYVDGGGTGTGWTNELDFNKNPWWGRYLSTDQGGAYLEYPVFGSGFEVEYFAANNRGIPRLFINGVLATSVNFPTASFKNINTSTGAIDMYDSSATPVRKKFAVTGLSTQLLLIRLEVQIPQAKNISSLGLVINVGTIYEANSNGLLSYTPNNGYRGKSGVDDFAYALDWARDDRNFDSGALVKEEVPVIRTILNDTRVQRVSLPMGATTMGVSFVPSFDDADYSLTCSISNMVDAVIVFRPITLTSLTATGFVVDWNDPIESSNYYLNYIAVKYT